MVNFEDFGFVSLYRHMLNLIDDVIMFFEDVSLGQKLILATPHTLDMVLVSLHDQYHAT